MAILSTAKIVGMLASAKKTGKQILNAAGEYVVEVVEISPQLKFLTSFLCRSKHTYNLCCT